MLQSQHNMQVGVLLFAAIFIFASTLIGVYARLSTYNMKQTSTLAQVSNNYGYRVSEAPLHAQLINVNCSIYLHLAICAITPPEGIAIQYDLTTFALNTQWVILPRHYSEQVAFSYRHRTFAAKSDCRRQGELVRRFLAGKKGCLFNTWSSQVKSVTPTSNRPLGRYMN